MSRTKYTKSPLQKQAGFKRTNLTSRWMRLCELKAPPTCTNNSPLYQNQKQSKAHFLTNHPSPRLFLKDDWDLDPNRNKRKQISKNKDRERERVREEWGIVLLWDFIELNGYNTHTIFCFGEKEYERILDGNDGVRGWGGCWFLAMAEMGPHSLGLWEGFICFDSKIYSEMCYFL